MSEDKVRRSIRSTAGNRYDALLRSEEKDEFYEGHYGGFTEEENDDDFSGSSSSDESISDSSSEEGEESEAESNETEKVERKRKKNVYKDPAKSKRKTDSGSFAAPKRPKLSHATNGERKSSRKHTTEQRHELEQTIKTRELVEKKKKPKKAESQLSQEQKMAEALKTEEYNLSQLHLYQEMEASRKNKSKRKKAKKVTGPSIKFTSKTVQTGTDDDKTIKEAHNYVEFSDRASYEKAFVFSKPVAPKREFCIITGKLARYRTRDGIPFFDSAAYKLIESRRTAKT